MLLFCNQAFNMTVTQGQEKREQFPSNYDIAFSEQMKRTLIENTKCSQENSIWAQFNGCAWK